MYPLKCGIVNRTWSNVNPGGKAQSHVTSSRSRFVGTTEKPLEGEGKKKGGQGYFRLARGGGGGF